MHLLCYFLFFYAPQFLLSEILKSIVEKLFCTVRIPGMCSCTVEFRCALFVASHLLSYAFKNMASSPQSHCRHRRQLWGVRTRPPNPNNYRGVHQLGNPRNI